MPSSLLHELSSRCLCSIQRSHSSNCHPGLGSCGMIKMWMKDAQELTLRGAHSHLSFRSSQTCCFDLVAFLCGRSTNFISPPTCLFHTDESLTNTGWYWNARENTSETQNPLLLLVFNHKKKKNKIHSHSSNSLSWKTFVWVRLLKKNPYLIILTISVSRYHYMWSIYNLVNTHSAICFRTKVHLWHICVSCDSF